MALRHATITTTSADLTPGEMAAEVQALKAQQAVWFAAGIVNALLVLRMAFLLFGAREVGFASFLYSLTHPLIAPFAGIFPAPVSGGSYFDTAALVAIAVYGLVAWAVVGLIDLGRAPEAE